MQVTVINTAPRTYLNGGRHSGRPTDPRIARRRKCLTCGARFTTEERYKDDDAQAQRDSLAKELRAIAERIEHTPH